MDLTLELVLKRISKRLNNFFLKNTIAHRYKKRKKKLKFEKKKKRKEKKARVAGRVQNGQGMMAQMASRAKHVYVWLPHVVFSTADKYSPHSHHSSPFFEFWFQWAIWLAILVPQNARLKQAFPKLSGLYIKV